MSRAFSYSFYHSKTWTRTRNEYAASKHGLCERCLSLGVVNTGEIVHHIKELTPENINDSSISLSWDNLELVCRKCHADLHRHTYAEMNSAKLTPIVREGFGFDLDGNLVDNGNSLDPHGNGCS